MCILQLMLCATVAEIYHFSGRGYQEVYTSPVERSNVPPTPANFSLISCLAQSQTDSTTRHIFCILGPLLSLWIGQVEQSLQILSISSTFSLGTLCFLSWNRLPPAILQQAELEESLSQVAATMHVFTGKDRDGLSFGRTPTVEVLFEGVPTRWFAQHWFPRDHCIIEFCPTSNREGGPIQSGIFLHEHHCIAGVILSGCYLSYDVEITSSVVL